ncbi:MAG: TadE/TadG family type IV pilus assembly protein [Pseudomonadota bacterium]
MRNLPVPGVFAPRWQKKLQAFADDHRGIAAVEFAMIAIPFFLLIFGLLEVSVLFIMSSVLEHAANEASRQIRTGQFQQAGHTDPSAQFRANIESELFGLLDGSKVKIDVRTFDSFGNTTGNDSQGDSSALAFDTTTGALDDSGFKMNAGAQNQIVVIRVFYEWELMIPGLSAPLQNMTGTAKPTRLIQSTVAFRNEPFGS